MTTTTGALIRSTDFDDLQSFLSRILGDQVTNYPNDPIAATYGYGQTLLSGQVTSVVDEVKAVQIAKLKSDIIKVATHCGLQNDSHITNLPTINQHDIILASHLQAYQSCLNFLSTNRFLLGSGQYSDELLSPDLSNNRVLPWGNNSSYKSAQLYGGETVRHAFTIDFRNPQAARYFFNSGSSLRLSASRTGGRVSQQNLSWTRTLNNMGTIIFDHSSCTSSNSVGSGSSIGFYQLTNNAQTVFTMAGDSTYSCLLYTSPSPRDRTRSRMPSSA